MVSLPRARRARRWGAGEWTGSRCSREQTVDYRESGADVSGQCCEMWNKVRKGVECRVQTKPASSVVERNTFRRGAGTMGSGSRESTLTAGVQVSVTWKRGRDREIHLFTCRGQNTPSGASTAGAGVGGLQCALIGSLSMRMSTLSSAASSP